MMDNNIIVGVTGKTGAGKSTVSALLKDKGAAIIDGDVVAREVLERVPELTDRLCEAFGADIVVNSVLDRRLLAQRAFKNEESTEALNKIMHPAITELIMTQAENSFSEGKGVVVIDAAALIESGIADRCNYLVFVTAPEELRIERIIARDGISREAAYIRARAQKPDDFYFDKSDFVIRNYPPYSITDEMLWLNKCIFGN